MYLLSAKLLTMDTTKCTHASISTINKLGVDTVVAIFLFQDVLSDSYLNKKTILEMKNYMLDLSSKVYVYPPVEIIYIFALKKLNLKLK